MIHQGPIHLDDIKDIQDGDTLLDVNCSILGAKPRKILEGKYGIKFKGCNLLNCLLDESFETDDCLEAEVTWKLEKEEQGVQYWEDTFVKKYKHKHFHNVTRRVIKSEMKRLHEEEKLNVPLYGRYYRDLDLTVQNVKELNRGN